MWTSSICVCVCVCVCVCKSSSLAGFLFADNLKEDTYNVLSDSNGSTCIDRVNHIYTVIIIIIFF